MISLSRRNYANKYNEVANGSRRKRPMNGQQIAYAPPGDKGDTTLETESLTLGAEYKKDETPHFWPIMAQADVDIPAVKQLLGTPAKSIITLEPTFTAAAGDSFGNNGQVFARIAAPPKVEFSAEQAGGLVAPTFSIDGLSRALGPVGGITEPAGEITDRGMVDGVFRPEAVFPGDSIVLLGGIPLRCIIAPDIQFNPTNTEIPHLTVTRDDKAISTVYEWNLPRAQLVRRRATLASIHCQAPN